MAESIAMPLVGYLVGGIPFGVIVARLKGVDLFTAGSGNIGATNVGRLLGKPYGFLVFLCDFLKGFIPAGLAVWLRGQVDSVAVLTGLAAILGHMFSPYLRLRGGKGVATGAGAVAILLPVPAGLGVLAFISTIIAGCTMALASIVAAVTFAGSQMSLDPDLKSPVSLLALAVALLVVYRHSTNIARLRAGTEPRLDSLERWSWLGPGLHCLAIGLWFGSAVFFSLIVAPLLFSTFAGFAANPPAWLVPNGSTHEMGSRLAGVAVGPIFAPYFILQAICGIIAMGTAVGFLVTQPGKIAKWRAILVVVAIVLVAVGWPITQIVNDLRLQRFESQAARDSFAAWHGISLVLNLVVLSLLTPVMALAAYGRTQSSHVATGGR
jgi:acyl-phosphate glycerol 3-phosphate acyltransferase